MLLLFYFVILSSSALCNFGSATERNENSSTTTIMPSKSSNVSEDLGKYMGKMEKNAKSIMKDIMSRIIMPFAMKLAFSTKASSPCLLDLLRVTMASRKLKPWALKMVDSYGKISGGILEGTTSDLGDYDECLDITIGGIPSPKERTGAYCLLEIKPPGPILNAIKDFQVNKERNHSLEEEESLLSALRNVRTNPNHMMFRLGICMPSSCKVEDVQDLIDLGISTALEGGDLPVRVNRCEAKEEPNIQTHELLILGTIGIIVFIVIFGTCIDCLKNYEVSDPDSSSLKEAKEAKEQTNPGRCHTFVKSVHSLCSKFSMCNSVSKLLNCDSYGDAYDAIKGINFLTIVCVIFFHTYGLPHPLHLYRFRNTLNFTKFIDEFLFGAVANSSVGVDTFFFLGGFYFIYNRWKLAKRPKIVSYIMKFIILMFIRITASQLLIGALFFLLPVFGSGPLWEDFVQGPLNNCIESWWMNLLFIQNFLGPYDICLYQTWIFATMMQIFIITAILVFLMHRWPSCGVLINVMVITAGILAMATVTAIAGYPATFSIYFYDYRTAIYFWKHVYTQAYTHIAPHCIGMLTAFFITEYPAKKLDKRFVLLSWIASMFTMCSIIFGLHSYRDGHEMIRSLAVFYAAVHRPAWAIVIGWIIYACATGHGGIINSFLTWKAFVPLERLSYLAYLLHIPIMYYHGGVQRERMFMGHYNQIMCFLAYAVASFSLAFVCYVIFQAPYEVLEKLFISKSESNSSSDNAVSNSEMSPKSAKSQKKIDEEENVPKVLISRH